MLPAHSQNSGRIHRFRSTRNGPSTIESEAIISREYHGVVMLPSGVLISTSYGKESGSSTPLRVSGERMHAPCLGPSRAPPISRSMEGLRRRRVGLRLVLVGMKISVRLALSRSAISSPFEASLMPVCSSPQVGDVLAYVSGPIIVQLAQCQWARPGIHARQVTLILDSRPGHADIVRPRSPSPQETLVVELVSSRGRRPTWSNECLPMMRRIRGFDLRCPRP